MSGQLGELVVSLSADIARFSSDMGKASKIAESSAKDMSAKFDQVGAAISKTAGLLAGLAGVTSLGALVKGSIDAADNMSKMSQKVGVAIEQLSGMAYAASLADVSTEKLGIGMGKLAKLMYEAAGDSNSGPAKIFENLGISVNDAAGKLRGTDEVMMDVADRMAGMKDGAGKTAIAMEIFGKSGADLIPLLNGGKQGMKEAADEAQRFGLILSEEAGKRAEDFNDNLTRLKAQATGVAMVVFNELSPAILEFMDGIAKGGNLEEFTLGLHSVQAELMRMAMLADKAGGSLTTLGYYMTGGKFTETGKWWKEQNEMYAQRYADTEKKMQTLANLEVGLDANGNKIVPKAKKAKGGSGGDAPDKAGTGIGSFGWSLEDDLLYKNMLKNQAATNAAHDAYIKYESAFQDRLAAEIKAGAAEAAEINRQAYESGLIGLTEYLDSKHSLNQAAIQAEITAKQAELDAARKAEAEAKSAYGLEGSADKAKLLNEAYAKTEKAIQAVTEAQSKLTIAKLIDGEETKKSLQTEIEDRIKIADAMADAVIQIAKINGQDTTLLENNKAIQDSKNKIKQLEESIGNAKSNQFAITRAQILVEEELLKKKQQQADVDLRRGILNGSISGLQGGYNAQGQWEYTAAQKYSVANPYISDSSLMSGGRSNTTNNSPTNNINVTVNGGADAASTGRTIAQEVRNGIVSFQYGMMTPINGGYLP